MLEIIQHFLLQNYKTILHIYIYIYIYIYTSIFGTLGVTVFIRTLFCSCTHSFTHTRTHYIDAHEKSHSDCSQSLIRSFRLLFYAFRNSALPISHSNSPFPISRKSAVICRWSARNYRNKPYIAESAQCLLSRAI